MDVLSRITQLRLERGWTEYELAKRSGMAQSTISTWYRADKTPSLASLENICHGFEIFLSRFFLDEDSGDPIIPTKQELRLLSYASRLEPEQYEAMLQFLKSLHPDAGKDVR